MVNHDFAPAFGNMFFKVCPSIKEADPSMQHCHSVVTSNSPVILYLEDHLV